MGRGLFTFNKVFGPFASQAKLKASMSITTVLSPSKELKKLGVDAKVVHNASFMNEIGVCGLQLYGYGETISKPFFTETWRHDIKIKRN
ncbi:hypothetical protein ACS0TY_033488 [Phlomoides rotata]